MHYYDVCYIVNVSCTITAPHGRFWQLHALGFLFLKACERAYRTRRFLSPEKSTLVIRVMLFLSRSLLEKEGGGDRKNELAFSPSLSQLLFKFLDSRKNSRPPDARTNVLGCQSLSGHITAAVWMQNLLSPRLLNQFFILTQFLPALSIINTGKTLCNALKPPPNQLSHITTIIIIIIKIPVTALGKL